MSAFHHYELLCDAPGCAATINVGEATADATRRKAAQVGWVLRSLPPAAGHQWPRAIDLCPDHADGDRLIPEAGESLPAVCVDEVELPVEALREIRDCLAERARWFVSRRLAVPEPTRLAMEKVDAAIRFAAGELDAYDKLDAGRLQR
jgi:hypothetical protein